MINGIAMMFIAAKSPSLEIKPAEYPATIEIPMPELRYNHGNAERKKSFGLFLMTDRGRAWRLKHRRRRANA
jgi:hypothetical protein